jgi:cytochrome c-type biogenesis protein CcsB
LPNQHFAAISDHLFVSAVVVYVLALFAYAAQFAFGRRVPGSVRLTVPAGRLTVPAGRPAEVGVLVPAGAGPAPRSQSAERTGSPDVPGGPAPRAGRIGRVAVALTVLGVLLHVAEVVTRGVADGFANGRLPWGNMYEFSSVAALIAVVGFLVLQWRQPRTRDLGVFVMLPVVCYLGLAGTVLYVKAGPLVPALHSYWLKIHVVAAMTATGTFMVAGVVSCLHLVRRRYETGARRWQSGPRGALATRLPSAAALDRAEYRIIAFAFPVWTFAIIAGAIWAESAWGRYWGWDPKETWSFVTWVIYAAYLHARSTRAWRRWAPAVALLGFTALMFNYYIINIFISGLHSYAGV